MTGCDVFFDSIGDLDFDGTALVRDPELGCTWQFGNVQKGENFGGNAQWGSVTPSSIGAFTGPIMRNPRNCRR